MRCRCGEKTERKARKAAPVELAARECSGHSGDVRSPHIPLRYRALRAVNSAHFDTALTV